MQSAAAKVVVDDRAIARAVAVAVKPYREALLHNTRELEKLSKAANSFGESIDWELAHNIERNKTLGAAQVSGGEILRKDLSEKRKPAPAGPQPAKTHPRPIESGDVQLKAGARKMLTILAQWHPEPKTRDELGALAGFAASGGTFSDYLSKLRMAGFIVENGRGIGITDEGLASVGDIPPRPDSTEELVGMWKSKFKAGVGKMLDTLVTAYPAWISRELLGERSGFTASGGTFGDYLSQLRRARLIEENGSNVKAADSLFP